MKKNVNALSLIPCSGCGACQSVCPHKAITVPLNADGYFQALVDEEKCIGCGLCQTVCARFVSPESHTQSMRAFQVAGAYSSTKEVQQHTTSGGIAYEIARWGIENGYKILGVIYDYSADRAVSVLIDDVEQLPLLRGSKYLQSNAAPAFEKLVAEAKSDSGRKYICFGTPCQIFGLRQLIARKHLKNEFLLVDLFCHGVPSYLAWQPYVRDMRIRLGDLRQVNFRYKGNGWHQYTIRLQGVDGTYEKICYRDPFYRYFFDNVVLNASCFTCAVRKERVASDLRLGDFLGGAYEGREDGVSAVLAATPRGEEIMRQLQASGRIVVDTCHDASVCLASQSTEDYPGRALRDAVISRLRSGQDYKAVQRWYFSRMPFPKKSRSLLKQIAALLPLRLLICVRRAIRGK